ncbi:hypothetical protein SOVF_069490, partial [Spinacia oleracea]
GTSNRGTRTGGTRGGGREEGGWGLCLGGETAPRGDGDGGLGRQKQAREGGEGCEQGRNQGRRGVMVTGGLGGGSGWTGRRRNREAPGRRWWWWCGFAAAKQQGRGGKWPREQGKAGEESCEAGEEQGWFWVVDVVVGGSWVGD